jgi:hypothetical protein
MDQSVDNDRILFAKLQVILRNNRQVDMQNQDVCLFVVLRSLKHKDVVAGLSPRVDHPAQHIIVGLKRIRFIAKNRYL